MLNEKVVQTTDEIHPCQEYFMLGTTFLVLKRQREVSEDACLIKNYILMFNSWRHMPSK